MMQLDRRVEVAGVLRASRSLHAPELKIQLVESHGVDFDTRPVADALGISLRARMLTVVLDGVYETERAVAERGAVLLESRTAWRERWSGERQRFLTLVWPEGDDAGEGIERLGASGRRAWQTVADELASPAPDHRRVVAAARAAASRAGVVLPEVRAEVPPEVARVAHALGRALTRLDRNPQWVDLEAWTGLSSRQLRRAFEEHPRWLGQRGFRGMVKLHRLQTATALLGAPDLSARRVARALGYGSDRAMHTALRRVGLGRGA